MTEPEVVNCLAPFKAIEAMMAQYEQENKNLVFDYRDPEGNKEARSHVYKLRRVKTEIADVHKRAKAEALEVCRKLDAYKNKLTGQVEEMIAVHNEPLMLIAKEEAEAEAEKQRLILEAKEKAEKERLAEIERREAEVKAREEAVKRQERERQREAEAKRVEAERIEREKKIAEEAKARAEAEAKRALEEAERKHQAELEAERQRILAEQREQELARIRAEEVAKAERLRKEEADRKRREDERHQAEVNAAIVDRLIELSASPALAGRIVIAMRDGTVPHVKIEY